VYVPVKTFHKDQQFIVLVLGLAILLVGLFRPFHPFASILGLSRTNLASQPSRQCMIEVAGAVKHPGIYTLYRPPTAYQAIQSAGGPIGEHPLLLEKSGDTLDTGIRAELQDSNTGRAQLMITPMSNRKKLVLGIPMEINQAHVEDIAMIPGISYGLALRLVEFRQTHGPFRACNDLRRVDGMGPRKVERVRPYLNLK
jgi:competence protein ComEA